MHRSLSDAGAAQEGARRSRREARAEAAAQRRRQLRQLTVRTALLCLQRCLPGTIACKIVKQAMVPMAMIVAPEKKHIDLS
jgi:hypothetical protein